MKRLNRPLALAAFALLAAAPLSAQGIDGAWITEFDRRVTNDNGNVSTSEKARARITLRQKGDSVTGTWEPITPGNASAKPRQLRGTISGNKVSISAEFEATVNMNGEQSTRTIVIVYDFTVTGDKLEGTMTNKAGDMDMPPRPFTAWRDKA